MDRSALGVLMLSLGALAACGGSGGGDVVAPPPDPVHSVFDGRYTFASVGGRSVGASIVTALTGQLTSDGLAQATLVASFVNLNGSVVPALPSTSSFTVDAQQTLTLVSPGGEEFRGQISGDGALLALSSSSAGHTPGILLAVRTAGVFGLGSLDGTYRFGIAILGQAPSLTTRFGTLTFDGAGLVTSIGSINTNANGTVLIAPGTAPGGTYAVFADGSVSCVGPLGTFSGGLLQGGSLGFLAGSVAGNPALMVMVKVDMGLGNATFDGTYGTARLFFTGLTETNFASLAGPTIADGLGTLTSADLLVDREAAIGAGFTRSATYTVAGNGLLAVVHVPTGSAEILGGNGAVEAQGRFAFHVGNVNPGEPPALECFVRR